MKNFFFHHRVHLDLTILLSILLVAIIGSGPSVFAADEKEYPKLTEEEMNSPEFVLLPSPTELLESVSGLSEIDWSEIAEAIQSNESSFSSDFPEDEKKAVNLGFHVANAFIGLYAADGDLVEKSATAIQTLAGQLGAGSVVSLRAEEINKLVAQGRWPQALTAVEAMRGDVIRELESFDDQTSVALANAGGWIRGTEVVSHYISANYSPSAGKLFRQKSIMESLLTSLGDVETFSDSSAALVDEIRKTLQSLADLSDTTIEEPVTQENIEKISILTRDAVAGLSH